MRNLSWYVKRARVMPAREVFHRIGEHVVLAKLRNEHRFGGAKFKTEQHPKHFRFCSERSYELPPLGWDFHLADEEVLDLLEGRWPAFGFPWKWKSDSCVWSDAPDTGNIWPRKFFNLIPYQTGNPFGDVRVAWEPSRLQQLVSLALLARHDAQHEEKAVELIETELASWVVANPPLTGIHYISAMECALRLIAVCQALDLIRNRLHAAERTWTSLLQLVASHAPLIAKRLSLYSSAGNHTIAEGCGLVYAGTLFPEFPDAAAWKTVGIRILNQESVRQVLPDGGGIEQALGYQLFIIDLLGLTQGLLEHRGEPIPDTIANAVRKGRTFLNAFGDSQKNLPSIGDKDGGYALSRHLRISWDEVADRSVANITFPDSGYTILSGCPPSLFRLTFDHGALGMPPCFAHGHADALSVILYCGNQEILADPGTYTYTGDGAWRTYFRGTRAHNTVIVDRLDQAVQETAFLWSQPFGTRLLYRNATPDGAVIVIARHDGYEKRLGVIHWRAVAYDPAGRWLIWDYLAGSGSHLLELNWHLAVNPTTTKDGHTLQWDGGLLYLLIDGGMTTLHKGDSNPISGWRSAQYGLKEPISTLRTTFTGNLPHEFITQGQLDGLTSSPQVLTLLSFFRRFVHETQAH